MVESGLLGREKRSGFIWQPPRSVRYADAISLFSSLSKDVGRIAAVFMHSPARCASIFSAWGFEVGIAQEKGPDERQSFSIAVDAELS